MARVTGRDVAPRRAVSSDLDRLLILVRAFYQVDAHDFDEAKIRLALVPLLVDDSLGQVWVIESHNGELTGYAVVTWSYSLESGGRDCILDEIYVENRSNGVGSRLLETAIRSAGRVGARSIFLETESHNSRAREFYVAQGFKTEDSVWMSRSL